ncbi:hypothetical protein [Clostridium botulinum]|uniref:hypothetical protein n=1 Tax=Clostridium botulinum TaxID=1491 RepID=UPI0013C7E384|nr:hypothetical protein [Clostridium botulinum]
MNNSQKRETLIEKIQKAQDFAKNNHSDEVAIYLTPSELRLVKIGVRSLHEYENIIEEELSN